jgi:serine phosphatase RsbU (regulator of sigma subunit)
MLTTDGIIDRIAPGGARFGERRLREILFGRDIGRDGRGVITLRDDIASRLDAFGGQAAPDDDMTLVVCQYLGAADSEAQRAASG